jgi:hypothetical protein
MTTADAYNNVLRALMLFREARGQSYDAKRGVLHVELNREAKGFRGHDAVSVILWPMQFSSFNANDPNAHLLPNPKNAMDWAAWLDCCALVDSPGDDPTGGAVMYESCDSDSLPAWADDNKRTATIGPFRFYRA